MSPESFKHEIKFTRNFITVRWFCLYYTILFIVQRMIWYGNLKHVQIRMCICVCTCVTMLKLEGGKYSSVFQNIYNQERNVQRAFVSSNIFKDKKRLVIWMHLNKHLICHRLIADLKKYVIYPKAIVFMRTLSI